MREIFNEIYQALNKGQKLALASIISDKGSTPRSSGSKMIVYPNGDSSGTIGGGAVEGDVIQRALRRFDARGAEIVSYDLSNNVHAGQMDLICGGRIKVLIEYLAANDENRGLFGFVNEELKRSRPFQWIGKITGDGGQLNVEHALQNAGDGYLGPLDVTPEIQKQIESCRGVSNGFSFIEFERDALFIEFIRPSQTLFLFGAGHVSKEITVLGKRVGFRIVVIDDRVEFANAKRFPEADEIRVIPEYAGVFTGVSPNPDDLIVIMTRGHSFDKEVLDQALKTEAGYIGMIGSRRKKSTIYKKLMDQGVTPGTLERVNCPIGLPIEAETPAEIAVSVVAQLIHHRAGPKPNGG